MGIKGKENQNITLPRMSSVTLRKSEGNTELSKRAAHDAHARIVVTRYMSGGREVRILAAGDVCQRARQEWKNHFSTNILLSLQIPTDFESISPQGTLGKFEGETSESTIIVSSDAGKDRTNTNLLAPKIWIYRGNRMLGTVWTPVQFRRNWRYKRALQTVIRRGYFRSKGPHRKVEISDFLKSAETRKKNQKRSPWKYWEEPLA